MDVRLLQHIRSCNLVCFSQTAEELSALINFSVCTFLAESH